MSATTATPAVATPATTTPSLFCRMSTKAAEYKKSTINWIAANTHKSVEKLNANETDGTVKKVARFVAAIIAVIPGLILAAIGASFKAVKNFVFPAKVDTAKSESVAASTGVASASVTTNVATTETQKPENQPE